MGMRTLIVVPKTEVGRAWMDRIVRGWEEAGKEITNKRRDFARTCDDDKVTIITANERGFCGELAHKVVVHLDVVCRKDYRDIEVAVVAAMIGAGPQIHTCRVCDYKVYSTVKE